MIITTAWEQRQSLFGAFPGNIEEPSGKTFAKEITFPGLGPERASGEVISSFRDEGCNSAIKGAGSPAIPPLTADNGLSEETEK